MELTRHKSQHVRSEGKDGAYIGFVVTIQHKITSSVQEQVERQPQLKLVVHWIHGPNGNAGGGLWKLGQWKTYTLRKNCENEVTKITPSTWPHLHANHAIA